MRVQISVTIDAELLKELEEKRSKTGLSISQQINMALRGE